MNYILQTNSLTKKYKNFQALNGLTMNVPKGSIYGFVGKNGAGKTTLIRLICGLQEPTSGNFSLYGIRNDSKDIIKSRRRMGAVVETPSIYMDMTAEENLKQQYLVLGLPSYEGIPELLKLVGLENTGKKKAKNFSLGMKQRLGIAIALAGDPDFLVLDEPVNGLDPQGIKELRDILKELAHKEGTCVVVSSHLMSEMEMMCDRVGIIANGKMIGSYTMEELISQSDSSIAEYVLEVDDPQKAMSLIMLADEGKRIDKETGAVVLSIPAEIEKKKIASVNKTLIEGGVSLYTVHRRENKKLEDVFIELTGGKEGGVQIG